MIEPWRELIEDQQLVLWLYDHYANGGRSFPVSCWIPFQNVPAMRAEDI